MNLFCWLFRHKLTVIATNPDHQLDKVLCLRCGKLFAMHHPTKYFGEWDDEDQEILDQIFTPPECGESEG